MATKKHLLEAALKAQKKRENIGKRRVTAIDTLNKKYKDEWSDYFDTLSEGVREILQGILTHAEEADSEEDGE